MVLATFYDLLWYGSAALFGVALLVIGCLPVAIAEKLSEREK